MFSDFYLPVIGEIKFTRMIYELILNIKSSNYRNLWQLHPETTLSIQFFLHFPTIFPPYLHSYCLNIKEKNTNSKEWNVSYWIPLIKCFYTFLIVSICFKYSLKRSHIHFSCADGR